MDVGNALRISVTFPTLLFLLPFPRLITDKQMGDANGNKMVLEMVSEMVVGNGTGNGLVSYFGSVQGHESSELAQMA